MGRGAALRPQPPARRRGQSARAGHRQSAGHQPLAVGAGGPHDAARRSSRSWPDTVEAPQTGTETEREVARTLGNVRRITTEQLKAIDKELGASRDQIVSMARLTYQRAGRGAIFVDIHDPEAGVVAPRYALRQAFLGEGDDAEPFKDIAAALDDYDPEREAVVIMALDSALLAYRLDNQEQEQGRYNPFAII